MTKSLPISRRRLLGAATAAAFTIVPRHVLGQGQTPPSDKLNIAGIGIGGQGGEDLKKFPDENIVALCDVDRAYAAHTFERYPRAVRYKDYREMFDKKHGIDAVVVGTPDHLHAPVSMMALKHGKHLLHIDLALGQRAADAGSLIASWIEMNRIDTLNVAGPRASNDPAIYSDAAAILSHALQ